MSKWDKFRMKWANDNGYVVFTHDLDFGALLATTHAQGPSVIQIRTQDILSQALQIDFNNNKVLHGCGWE
jgi:predicted nuclease of predicted toxin-antitoxin system